VNNFVEPDVFKQLEEEALKLGFIHVESGPLVRSSYHAEKHIL
jgi:lipoic acid synthetase